MPVWGPPLTSHTPRRSRGDRDPTAGATLVEYALAVGLVALAMVGGLNLLESASRGSLEDRAARAGSPDLGPGVPVSSTTVPPTTGAPVDPGTTSLPTLSPTASLEWTALKDGSDWVATVVVTVVDPATNAPVPRVNVVAEWSDGYTASTSCITSDDGTCPLSSAEINRTGKSLVPAVTLTITAISGDGVTYTQPPPSVVVPAPGT